MPLRSWRCPECGLEFQTKTQAPVHCGDVAAETILTAPKTKFMEKVDHEHNKSNVIGQQAILKERARAHSRDHETDDLIDTNTREVAEQNKWITEGRKRKKIDDL